MYDTRKTRVSLGALVELNEALRAYRRDFVLVGGWVPYFITKPHFDHCGSIDIDLVFGPKVFRKTEHQRCHRSARVCSRRQPIQVLKRSEQKPDG